MGQTVLKQQFTIELDVVQRTCDGCANTSAIPTEVRVVSYDPRGVTVTPAYDHGDWNQIALEGHACLHLCPACTAQTILACRAAARARAEQVASRSGSKTNAETDDPQPPADPQEPPAKRRGRRREVAVAPQGSDGA